jgi:hypothetical protein
MSLLSIIITTSSLSLHPTIPSSIITGGLIEWYKLLERQRQDIESQSIAGEYGLLLDDRRVVVECSIECWIEGCWVLDDE